MRRTIEEWMKDPLTTDASRVAYAAMREWSAATDQHTGKPWSCLSEEYRDHIRKVVARALAAGEVPTAKELHEACLAQAVDGGWKQGPVDYTKKTHPDIKPWGNLSFDQRMKDHILSSILHAFIEG